MELVQGFAARTIDAGFVTGDVNSPVVASMLNADTFTMPSETNLSSRVSSIYRGETWRTVSSWQHFGQKFLRQFCRQHGSNPADVSLWIQLNDVRAH